MVFVHGEPLGDAARLADVDLAGTVTNLSRVRAKNRARLANSDLTRAFLNAALSLSDEVFSSGDHDLTEGTRQTLSYLSRPRVVSRAQQDYSDLVPTEAKFRDRWAGQQDFIDDFVSYALVVRRVSLKSGIERLADDALALGREIPDVAAALQRIAFDAATLVLEIPSFRLQLLTVASASAHPAVARAVKDMYAVLGASWLELFRRILAATGLVLRPGVTAEELAIMVQAMGEGLGLRLLAGLDEPPLDQATGHALLGKAVLGLIAGLADDGAGLTLEGAVNVRSARL